MGKAANIKMKTLKSLSKKRCGKNSTWNFIKVYGYFRTIVARKHIIFATPTQSVILEAKHLAFNLVYFHWASIRHNHFFQPLGGCLISVLRYSQWLMCLCSLEGRNLLTLLYLCNLWTSQLCVHHTLLVDRSLLQSLYLPSWYRSSYQMIHATAYLEL